MAKKKHANGQLDSTAPPDDTEVDAEVQSATDQVKTAREQLQAAEDLLAKAREKAVENVAKLKGKSAGELIDGSLEFVRKHPGLGVLAATSLGFLLGRLFRR